MTRYANSINSNLELNPTPENNNRVNFLDLTTIRNTPQLEIDVFRKSTTTDTTINYLSNHPQAYKLAAYRFLINRVHNLPLKKNRREHEWQTILQIAKNNHFTVRPYPLPETSYDAGKETLPSPLPPLNQHNPQKTKNGPHSPSYPHKSEKSPTC